MVCWYFTYTTFCYRHYTTLPAAYFYLPAYLHFVLGSVVCGTTFTNLSHTGSCSPVVMCSSLFYLTTFALAHTHTLYTCLHAHPRTAHRRLLRYAQRRLARTRARPAARAPSAAKSAAQRAYGSVLQLVGSKRAALWLTSAPGSFCSFFACAGCVQPPWLGWSYAPGGVLRWFCFTAKNAFGFTVFWFAFFCLLFCWVLSTHLDMVLPAFTFHTLLSLRTHFPHTRTLFCGSAWLVRSATACTHTHTHSWFWFVLVGFVWTDRCVCTACTHTLLLSCTHTHTHTHLHTPLVVHTVPLLLLP